jgi:hypothetical protein
MRFLQVLAAVWIGCAAAGCTRTSVDSDGEVPAPAPGPAVAGATEPSGAVARLDAHRWLAAPVVSVNLTVWPVVTDAPADLGEFLTLEEAGSRGVAKVTEVGAAGGDGPPPAQVAVGNAARPREAQQTAAGQTEEGDLSLALGDQVNALVVENTGDLPLLICAGTIVSGGNQDRQIGEDVVVAAHSKRRIEVFCVEQGRWESNRLGVSTNAVFGSANAIAGKQVRASGQYMKSQGEVWSEVAKVPHADAEIAQAASIGDRTTYLRNFENASKETTEARTKTVEAVRSHFGAARSAGSHVVGFAYSVNGKPVNLRTFAAPRVFEKQFEPFLQAMVIDAESARAEGPGPAAKAEDVIAMVEKIREAGASEETRAGYRLRLRKGDAGYNSNCYFARDEAAAAPGSPAEQIPLTEDWTAR